MIDTDFDGTFPVAAEELLTSLELYTYREQYADIIKDFGKFLDNEKELISTKLEDDEIFLYKYVEHKKTQASGNESNVQTEIIKYLKKKAFMQVRHQSISAS